jgi:hypothetical protein
MWYEITKDFESKAEARRAAAYYRRRDAGHSKTRVVRKPGGAWVVVQKITTRDCV